MADPRAAHAVDDGQSPADFAAVIRDEQKRRWRAGDRVPAEVLLREHPQVAADTQAAVDVIYGEFFLRETLGEHPSEEEFVRRFPAHAATLRDQIALHVAMETLGDESLGPPISRTEGPDRDGPVDLPEEFGRYRILSKLGQGGMGAVYLAHDSELDRRVALKVPHLANELGGRAAERFRREARIAAMFSHPNLCPILDVGEHDGIVYLTMPLIKNETLAARLAREKVLPDAEAARIASGIALAMVEAHASGVIHRDLKPANVMIDPRGEPIVMDFGLARSDLAETGSSTPWGMMLGTPTYMAPEQVGGDPADVSPSGDIYALGVILYQMLAGRPPYVGSLSEVLLAANEGKPTPPSKFNPGIAPAIEAACLKAMSRDPKDRFPTMAALAEALRPKPESPPTRGPSRRRAAIVAGSVACLLVPVALALFFLPRADPDAALQAGSTWVGAFVFRPPIVQYTGEVVLHVTERKGDRFSGTYATEGDSYVWECRGVVRGDSISWTFNRTVREAHPTDVVGRARVTGHIRGDAMKDLVFDNPGKGTADMSLFRDRQK